MLDVLQSALSGDTQLCTCYKPAFLPGLSLQAVVMDAGASWITQALLLCLGSIQRSMPIIAATFLAVITAWITSVRLLNRQLQVWPCTALCHMYEVMVHYMMHCLMCGVMMPAAFMKS